MYNVSRVCSLHVLCPRDLRPQVDQTKQVRTACYVFRISLLFHQDSVGENSDLPLHIRRSSFWLCNAMTIFRSFRMLLTVGLVPHNFAP